MSSSRDIDIIDITQLGDDAAQDGIGSPSNTEGDETVTGRSPSIELDPSPRIGGPVCPICNRGLGPETSNADLNEHLDLCLNRDAFSAELTPSPKKRWAGTQDDPRPAKKANTSKSKRKSKGAQQGGKGSVLEWLKRGS